LPPEGVWAAENKQDVGIIFRCATICAPRKFSGHAANPGHFERTFCDNFGLANLIPHGFYELITIPKKRGRSFFVVELTRDAASAFPVAPPAQWERARRLIQLIRRSKGLWMDDQVYFNRSFSEQAGEASVVFPKDVAAGGFEAADDGDRCFR